MNHVLYASFTVSLTKTNRTPVFYLRPAAYRLQQTFIKIQIAFSYAYTCVFLVWCLIQHRNEYKFEFAIIARILLI